MEFLKTSLFSHLSTESLPTMTRTFCAVLVLAFLWASRLADASSADVWVGTIVATTTTNNQTTAVPFVLPRAGAMQCDGAVYVVWGSSSGATATAPAGERVEANALFDFDATPTYRFLAVLPVSGTANCKVFERKTK
ncbi:MAG: hypothetical protein ABI398_13530 [Devosia sp.]